MYAFMRGVVSEMERDRLTLDVGGVGYELLCSGETLSCCKAGQEAMLYTHFHLAQDMAALYGFYTKEERAMFRQLISVSRVGPKVALAALSAMSPADLAAAIVTGNENSLARVPGLGKKTAQRVILELKEKISTQDAFSALPAGAAASPLGEDIRAEAMTALVALGYDPGTARRAVAAVPAPAETVEDLLKAALKSLGKR